MGLSTGSFLGPYEIVSPLGVGGMGEVYHARDTKLNRDVAIKILPEESAIDSDRIARFKREAQVLASLDHPNIGAIYGFEDSEPVHALVLQLVEGPTLAERIARGTVPIDEALPIARQIGEALEAAHDKGVIHRDLKPANIKITPDGTVKVLDFGLARLADPDGTRRVDSSMSPTITTPAMTAAGVILGTAAYMSPEQAKGKPADKRSDIWAFGCVLYEMLTGKRAFAGDDVAETLAAVIRGEPDWTGLPSDTPPSIRRLLRRCLEKDRKRRLADAADARLEIDEGLAAPREIATPTALPPSPTSAWRRPLVLGPALVLGALVAGLAGWILKSPSGPLTPARFAFTLPEGQQFTNTARTLVAISPDGTQLVYVANTRLYMRTISDFEAHVIPGTEIKEGIMNPVFSPDGRSIAFFSSADMTIKRVSASGGGPVTVCQAAAPFGMSWGTDGIVFGQGAEGILRVSPNVGKPERLASVNRDERASGPQMLPGGQALLFTLSKGQNADSLDTAQIVVQSLASGVRKTLIEGGSDARYLPTGHLVYAVGGNLLAVPFDPDRQEVAGGPVAVVEGVRRSSALTGTAHFSVSASGSLVYVPGPAGMRSGNARSLVLADRNGATTLLSVPSGPYVHPRVSRDGMRLAVGSDDGKEATVWIHDLSGTSAIRRLTFGGQNRFPIWSADSQRVAFQSDREGDAAIFWQRADGTGPVERLTKPEHGTSHVPESWSPDGRRLLFTVAKDSTFSLWTLSIEDRRTAPFGDVQSKEPIGSVFSPDGRWVAYGSNLLARGGSANIGVFVQPFPATGARYQVPKATNSRDYHPLWAPDGKELFFVPISSQFAAVSVTTRPSFAFGSPVSLPPAVQNNTLSYDVRSYDILPDGRFIGLVASGVEVSRTAAAPEIRVVLNWSEELKQRVPTK